MVVWPGLRKLRRRISTGDNANDLGDAVHVTFERKERLRRAKSAKRAVRRSIGGNGFGANADAGPIVSAAGVNGAAGKNDGRESFVGAAVDGEVDFSAENSAVFADSGAMAGAGRMALRGGRHVFHAVVNNFDRLAGLHGEERGVGGDHGRIFFLAAKSAAGFHLHDADAICGEVAELHEGFVDVVGTLKRTPHCEALLGIEGGDHSVIFDVELLLRAGGVFGFDDVVCDLPDSVDVAFFDQIGFESVVRAPDDLLERLAFFHFEDRGKRIVFDGNGFDGFREKMAVRMSEQEEGLFGMIRRCHRRDTVDRLR